MKKRVTSMLVAAAIMLSAISSGIIPYDSFISTSYAETADPGFDLLLVGIDLSRSGVEFAV